MPEPLIVLFDGECVLCNGFVDFLLKRRYVGRMRFGAIQSEVGQALLVKFGLQDLDTIVAIDGDRAWVKSDAVLVIAGRLGGGWPLLRFSFVLPRSLRNWVYDAVARSRYFWFGRQSCRLPAAEESHLFL